MISFREIQRKASELGTLAFGDTFRHIGDQEQYMVINLISTPANGEESFATSNLVGYVRLSNGFYGTDDKTTAVIETAVTAEASDIS